MKQTNNLALKQILSNIASNANKGRMADINWSLLAEGKKKKSVNEVSNMAPKKPKPDNTEERPADEIPSDDVGPAGTKPPTGNPDVDSGKGEPTPSDDGKGIEGMDLSQQDGPAPDADAASSEDEVGDAQADAAKSKAELEKAKAEKDQAEKEIKKQSYVQLVSQPGVHFLLGKLIDHAFKTNTIDSLATEMTSKLKIQTPEDFSNFSEEISPFKGIPGVSELLASMKGMATKTPEASEESDEEPMSESHDDNDSLESGVVSNCCGAKVMLGDICSDCKEHCEPENENDLDRELEEKISKY